MEMQIAKSTRLVNKNDEIKKRICFYYAKQKGYGTFLDYYWDCFSLPGAGRVVNISCSYVITATDASAISNSRTAPASHA